MKKVPSTFFINQEGELCKREFRTIYRVIGISCGSFIKEIIKQI